MKLAALLLFACVVVVAGCKDEDLTSQPVLTFKNNNYSKEMRLNELNEIELEVADDEGDVADTFYIVKNVINRNRPSSDTLSRESLPSHPVSQRTALLVRLLNAPIRPPGSNMIEVPVIAPGTDADTTVFKFFLVDQAKQRSNILATETILIRRN